MRKNRFVVLCSVFAFALSTFSLSSCWEEQHPGTYYTFTGQTVGSALASKPEYSDFVRILERAGLWTNLITYGENTCFAPNNNAIADYIKQREALARRLGKDVTYTTVDDLPKEDCDSLAWMHLLDYTCFMDDIEPPYLPKVNLNDRVLSLTFDSILGEQLGDSAVFLQKWINNALIEFADDSCENGVVHYVDRCIDFSGDYVYDLVDKDPKTKLFSQALKECGFHKMLSEWYDLSYKIGDDSIEGGRGVALTSAGNKYTVYYWKRKQTKFTILTPTDKVFNRYGINSLEDMFNYAKTIYTDYNDVDSILANYKDTRNPLYKFVAYHILPFFMNIGTINGREDIVKKYNAKVTFPEDYFETCLPKSLMRICSRIKNDTRDISNVYINSNIYTIINREAGITKEEGNGSLAFNKAKVRGAKVLTQEEMGISINTALNGNYYYVDDILVYDENVKENVLDRRLRIDCTTLSPDFITSEGRQKQGNDNNKIGTGFKDPKNFKSYQSEYTLSVRAPTTSSSYAYEGDGIDIEGQFDMYVKLPPVPHDGTWQLRISFRSNDLCGIIQTYWAGLPFGQEVERTDWKPLGLPIDLRVNLTDVTVGWIDDDDIKSQYSDEEEADAAIEALDKSMKNRGWMKGSDAQQTAGTVHVHRAEKTMGRLILATEYMTSNTDYYIRFKQLLANNKAEFLFDYIELVPKTVYDVDEDKH